MLLSCSTAAPVPDDASERPSTTASVAPEEGEEGSAWTVFEEPTAPVSFEIPADWEVVRTPTDYDVSEGLVQLEIRDEEGAGRLYFSNRAQGLGGACSPEIPVLTTTELDSTPIDVPGYLAPDPATMPVEVEGPRFVFRISEAENLVIGSLAVTNEPRPADSCMFYNVLRNGADAAFFTTAPQIDGLGQQGLKFASRAEAEAFVESEDYETLKRMLLSLDLSE